MALFRYLPNKAEGLKPMKKVFLKEFVELLVIA
jgi:hypothetical protein